MKQKAKEVRTSDYVCWDCGLPYLSEKQKDESSGTAVTAHNAECGLCGENKTVTHIRAWNYLTPH